MPDQKNETSARLNDAEQMPSAMDSREDFQLKFGKMSPEFKKNYLESLVSLREGEGKDFRPYTKESLLQINDTTYVCEILLAMNLRDSMLSMGVKDPQWIIAPYSVDQLMNFDPIYASKILIALNSRNEYNKLHGTGDMSTKEIAQLFKAVNVSDTAKKASEE